MKIRRTARRRVRIEMMPLIDIVFLLLVFFIYAMLSMAVHRGLHLDLPRSGQATVERKSPLSLFLKKEGGELQAYINEDQVDISSLDKRVAVPETETASPVLVFAERDISYQELFIVLDQLKKAGVENISLQAQVE